MLVDLWCHTVWGIGLYVELPHFSTQWFTGSLEYEAPTAVKDVGRCIGEYNGATALQNSPTLKRLFVKGFMMCPLPVSGGRF